jgi:hypothetical protein
MPRTRRRRANDRRREADQRRIAAEALERVRQVEKEKLGRYVKAVYRSRAGETVVSHDGRTYTVQHDGSLVRKEGMS